MVCLARIHVREWHKNLQHLVLLCFFSFLSFFIKERLRENCSSTSVSLKMRTLKLLSLRITSLQEKFHPKLQWTKWKYHKRLNPLDGFKENDIL